MITLTSADLSAWLASLLYPFFRVAALFSAAPLLSHRSLPRRLRVALAVAITVVLAPTLPPVAAASPFSAPGLLLLAQQLAIGLAIGIVLQLAFAAATLAGDVMGLQMGLSFASLVDPAHSEQTPIVGAFMSLALMLVFLAIDGHLLVLAALADSFRAFPLRADGALFPDWRGFAAAGGYVFAAGLSMALPVIAALTLTSLALGVLTRTAPQLNLFAVGFPLTLGVGTVMLLLAMPYVIPLLAGLFDPLFALLAR